MSALGLPDDVAAEATAPTAAPPAADAPVTVEALAPAATCGAPCVLAVADAGVVVPTTAGAALAEVELAAPATFDVAPVGTGFEPTGEAPVCVVAAGAVAAGAPGCDVAWTVECIPAPGALALEPVTCVVLPCTGLTEGEAAACPGAAGAA